jgi:hypothetical protein
MAAFGLVEDAATTDTAAAGDVVYLWPCNVRVWGIWQRIQTQWRSGMGGREGLDYHGVCAYLREVERIKPRRFADAFKCLQAMEFAALDEWAKQRKTEG